MSSWKTNKQVLYFQLTVAQGWFSSQKEGVGGKASKERSDQSKSNKSIKAERPRLLVAGQWRHKIHKLIMELQDFGMNIGPQDSNIMVQTTPMHECFYTNVCKMSISTF